MRGKTPKERDKYVIRMGDGILVEVSREVYLEWHRSRRRERYQRERDRKYGVCSLEELEEKGRFPEKLVGDMTQETVFYRVCMDKLWDILKKMPEQDIRLIRLLYFEGITVREAAEIFRCSRKAVGSRERKILEKIREGILSV